MSETLIAPAWRPMRAADLDAVLALADRLFPDHYEAPERFGERLRLSPATCFVLEGEKGALGYLVSYPQCRGVIPPLDGALGALPGDADMLYIHDLAIATEAAGQGAARAIVETLAARAREAGHRGLALVAVNHSTPFWERQGFLPVAPDAAGQAKLQGYGDDACYMVRILDQP